MGNVKLTTQALHFLMKEAVVISYYSYGGQYLGRTAAESSKNIFLCFPNINFTTMKRKGWNLRRRFYRIRSDISIELFLNRARIKGGK